MYKHAGKLLKLFVFLFPITIFLMCSPDITDSGSQGSSGPSVPTGASNLGNVYFQNPYHNQICSLDNTFNIRWTAGRIKATNYIAIQLFRGGNWTLNISTYTASDGLYSWVPSGLPSDTAYRIRIYYYNGTDTLYDFSPYFTIRSNYDGTLSVDAPAASDTFKVDSAMTIRWSSTGTIGYQVGLELYADTSRAAVITTTTASTGYYAWSYVSTTRPYGSRYRIKVYSTSDPSISAFSPYFTLQSRYSGSYTVTSPTTTTQAAAGGAAIPIRWTRTGNPGTLVRLDLFQGADAVYPIDSTETDSGYFSWAISPYTLNGTYRVRVASLSDTLISAYSDSFQIRGAPGPTGATGNGNIRFLRPFWMETVNQYGYLPVRWTPVGISASTTVSLQLFRGDSLYQSIDASELNDGYYNWYVSSSIPGDSIWRIRIRQNTDTTKYDLSPYFRVVSQYYGTFRFTSPLAGDTVKAESTYTFRWNFTGPSSNFTIRLYSDTAYAATIASYCYNNGYYAWSTVRTPLAYGDRYKIRIFHNYDSTVAGWSDTFTLSSRYNGGYTFVNPTSSSIWAAGSAATQTVQWTRTGNPGTYVHLHLYRDTVNIYSVAYNLYDTNRYVFNLPGYLSTGNRYRIRILSVQDTHFTALSDFFTISGLNPDAYEPDSTSAGARPLTLNAAAQSHTLTQNDTDWVTFSGVKGTAYAFRASGDVQTAGVLYRGGPSYYLTTFYGSATAPSFYAWNCDSTATYYLRVTPRYSGNYGSYTLALVEIDSLNLVTFTSPRDTSIWTAGTIAPITWTTDSLLFSNYVTVHLCIDTAILYTIDASEYDDGSYSWSIPTGLQTDSRYRILIRDGSNSSYRGFSNPFTITGIVRDAWEPDNRRASASAIPATGAAQARTIAFADTDWVTFEGRRDSLYLISATGTPYLYLYLYPPSGASYVTYDYRDNPGFSFACTSSGTYALRIYPYSSSYYGNYNLTVKGYGPQDLNVFSLPVASTIWTAGVSETMTWTVDTLLYSRYVNIALCRGGLPFVTLASSTLNDGTQSVTLPSGMASGGYRLRIQNASNLQIAGFSDLFSVSGMPGDAYEPDDSAAAAKPLTAGAASQIRNLTYHDTDWCAFTARPDHLYKIITTGGRAARIDLYSTDRSTLLSSANVLGADSNAALAWFCAAAGTYACRITSNTSGAYALTLSEFDSSGYRFQVTSPTPADTFTAGGLCSILWSDPAGVRDEVSIFLFNGSGIVTTAVAITPNDGSQTWTVPAALPARGDYFIRVVSRIHSSVYGISGPFWIR